MRFVFPESVDACLEALSGAGGRGRVLAGGTDLTLALRRDGEWPPVLVSLGRVREAAAIEDVPGEGLRVGGAVTMEELCRSPLVATSYQALADAAATVGGVQIRTMATVGGNVCTASPGADTPPALLVLGAIAEVARRGGRSRVDLTRFFTGPRRTVLDPTDVLVAFHLPPRSERSGSAYLRLTPRDALDLAVVGAAAAVTLESDCQTVASCRVAVGAVAPTPLLMADAGESLVGRVPDPRQLREAGERAGSSCRPITDVRGSAEYRRRMVPILVERALALALRRGGWQT